VELEWAKRLVVLARALLGELDPDDVGPGGGRVGDQPLLGRDAEEVVDVVELAVLDEQGVAPEAGALGEDHALGVGGELDFGQDLVGDVDGVGRRRLGDLGGAWVVDVLPACWHDNLVLERPELEDPEVVERQDVVLPGLLEPQALSSSSLSGCWSARSWASARSTSVWNSCQWSWSKWPRPIGTGPCSVTAFQPWCQTPRVPSIS
jgi:hypothetical protein